jgi:hypothetical protein
MTWLSVSGPASSGSATVTSYVGPASAPPFVVDEHPATSPSASKADAAIAAVRDKADL